MTSMKFMLHYLRLYLQSWHASSMQIIQNFGPSAMQVDRDGTVLLGDGDDSSSSDDDEQGVACMQGAEHAMEEDAPDAVPITAQRQGLPAIMQQGPVIDQDGFQTVRKPTRRRAVQTH